MVNKVPDYSALNVEAGRSSKVLVPNTILHDIIPEGITMYMWHNVFHISIRLNISESKWEKTRNSLGMPLCFVS